jgi:hypothetical protein
MHTKSHGIQVLSGLAALCISFSVLAQSAGADCANCPRGNYYGGSTSNSTYSGSGHGSSYNSYGSGSSSTNTYQAPARSRPSSSAAAATMFGVLVNSIQAVEQQQEEERQQREIDAAIERARKEAEEDDRRRAAEVERRKRELEAAEQRKEEEAAQARKDAAYRQALENPFAHPDRPSIPVPCLPQYENALNDLMRQNDLQQSALYRGDGGTPEERQRVRDRQDGLRRQRDLMEVCQKKIEAQKAREERIRQAEAYRNSIPGKTEKMYEDTKGYMEERNEIVRENVAKSKEAIVNPFREAREKWEGFKEDSKKKVRCLNPFEEGCN